MCTEPLKEIKDNININDDNNEKKKALQWKINYTIKF
jgi:hypothetical protein